MSNSANLDRDYWWGKGHDSGKRVQLEITLQRMREILTSTPDRWRETVRIAFMDLEKRLTADTPPSAPSSPHPTPPPPL